jgi:L-arabinose isomerase
MTKQQVAEWVREARTRHISEHQDAMRFADNRRFMREVLVLANQYGITVPAGLQEVCNG